MDQRAPSAGIGMLPLYLANCDNLVYHDHQDYQRRGWTRVERRRGADKHGGGGNSSSRKGNNEQRRRRRPVHSDTSSSDSSQ